MFDVLNEQRVNALRHQNFKQDTPEEITVGNFFLSYPRCKQWPIRVFTHGGAWHVMMPTGSSVFEAAAAAVALSEVTSLPIYNCTVVDHGDFDASAMETVRQEVAELRRLNLWGVQQ
ncbi:hypothetical protein [Agrobacterium pusense]|uniref:hypothetical protein n=1 Tax=Agrobacterium pusense TaxID=648995 RepID=UPI0038508852